MHEEGVVDWVVGLPELVLAPDLVEVFHVPAEYLEYRLNQGVLGVLLTDRLPSELGDPFSNAVQNRRQVVHRYGYLPRGSVGTVCGDVADARAQRSARASGPKALDAAGLAVTT